MIYDPLYMYPKVTVIHQKDVCFVYPRENPKGRSKTHGNTNNIL